MLGNFNETISVLWARLLAETLREHCMGNHLDCGLLWGRLCSSSAETKLA